jgi:hypothetical protein
MEEKRELGCENGKNCGLGHGFLYDTGGSIRSFFHHAVSIRSLFHVGREGSTVVTAFSALAAAGGAGESKQIFHRRGRRDENGLWWASRGPQAT